MNPDPQNPQTPDIAGFNPAAAAAPSFSAVPPTLDPTLANSQIPNPTMSTPLAPNAPVAASPAFNSPITAPLAQDFSSTQLAPDASASPQLDTSSFPPETPTLDSSLLAEAIKDVPAEAAVSPDANSPSPEANMASFAAAPASVDPSIPSSPMTDPTAPVATLSNPLFEEPKQPPSVAFNDPAQMPDKPPVYNPSKPSFMDKLKSANPVVLIFVGCTIVIVALVLILAFAV